MGTFLLLKYKTELGSDAIIYAPSFRETGSSIQILIRGRYRDNTNSTVIPLPCLYFLSN
jgi:hypothetical protein